MSCAMGSGQCVKLAVALLVFSECITTACGGLLAIVFILIPKPVLKKKGHAGRWKIST